MVEDKALLQSNVSFLSFLAPSLPPFLPPSLPFPSLSISLLLFKKYLEIGSYNVAWVAATFYVDQAGVKFIDSSPSVSQMLRSRAWTREVSLDAATLTLIRQLLFHKLSGPWPSFALASERERESSYKIQVLAAITAPLSVYTQTHLTLHLIPCLMDVFLYLPPQLA